MKSAARAAICIAALVSSLVVAGNRMPPTEPPPPPIFMFVDAYIGYAPMGDMGIRDETWVRRGALKINGTRLELNTSPLVCRSATVFSSESDGGFFTYEGEIAEEHGVQIATLTETSCDYCLTRKTKMTYRLRFQRLRDGSVMLGDVRMHRDNPPFPETCPAHASITLLPPESTPTKTTKSTGAR